MQVTLPVRQRGNCCEINLELKPAAVNGAVALLRLLADPARLQMMAALEAADQPVCVCDFTAALGLSQPTISHHMGKLKNAGLVKVTREGVWSFYELAPGLAPAERNLLGSAVAVGQAAAGSHGVAKALAGAFQPSPNEAPDHREDGPKRGRDYGQQDRPLS